MADQAEDAIRVEEVAGLESGEEHFEDMADTEGAVGFEKVSRHVQQVNACNTGHPRMVAAGGTDVGEVSGEATDAEDTQDSLERLVAAAWERETLGLGLTKSARVWEWDFQ